MVVVGAWKYAIGLSRKAMIREGDSSSIVRGKSYPDQSLAIFKKPVGSRNDEGDDDDDDDEKDGWIVHHILAVVELKMDDSACRSFALKENAPQDGDGAAATLEVVNEECFTRENDLRYP